jgi:type I restriction enzyme S subunit
VRLKRVFSVVNGSTPRSEETEYWDGDIPWVTPEDLGRLRFARISETRRQITDEGYQNCGTTLVPQGSLVLSTRAPIGHLAIADMPLCTNQGCRSLVFRRGGNEAFFFFQLFAARQELESLGSGSTFQELAKDRLEELFVVVPPEEEQRAIATFLDRETAKIDALVAKKERLIELLQEKRAALITRAVTKGLDPNVPIKNSGVEWLGEIPGHWTVSKLRYACSLLRDGTHLPPPRVASGWPLLSVRNIVYGKFVRLPDDSMVS